MANSINPRLITRPRGSKLIAPPRCSPSEDRRVNRLILRSPPIGRRRISPHHRVLSTKLLTPDPYDERLKQTAWAYSSGNSLFFADDSSVSGEGLSFQGIVDRFQINFRVNQRCSISRYSGEVDRNEIDSINRTGVSKLTHRSLHSVSFPLPGTNESTSLHFRVLSLSFSPALPSWSVAEPDRSAGSAVFKIFNELDNEASSAATNCA